MKRRLQRRTLLRCQELPRPQLLQRLMPSRPCWLLQQQQRQQRHRCLARTKVCQVLNKHSCRFIPAAGNLPRLTATQIAVVFSCAGQSK